MACLLAGVSADAKEKTVGEVLKALNAKEVKPDTVLRVGDAAYRVESNGLVRNVKNELEVDKAAACTAEGCAEGKNSEEDGKSGAVVGDWVRTGDVRDCLGEVLPAEELKKLAGEDLFLLVCCDAEGRVLEVSFQMSEKSGFTLEQVVALERYLKKRHRVDMSAKKGDKDVYRVMYMLSV